MSFVWDPCADSSCENDDKEVWPEPSRLAMRCPSEGPCASCAEWPVIWTEEENDETAKEDAAEDEEDKDIDIVPSDESEFIAGRSAKNDT